MNESKRELRGLLRELLSGKPNDQMGNLMDIGILYNSIVDGEADGFLSSEIEKIEQLNSELLTLSLMPNSYEIHNNRTFVTDPIWDGVKAAARSLLNEIDSDV